MTRPLRLGLLLLAVGTLPAADEPPNQTMVREAREQIVTIDGDLHRAGPTTAPALPLPGGWGQLELRGTASTTAWAAEAPVIAGAGRGADQISEHRRELDLVWRQTLGTPALTLEVEARGVHEDRTGSDHLGDLATLLVIPLMHQRYAGVSLAFGALTPLGDKGKDWITSHGTIRDASWTGLGELRGAFGIGLATVQMRAGAGYTPHGTNLVPQPQPADPLVVKDTLLQGQGALGVTWRFTRWLRFGAEQSYLSDRWQARSDQPGFSTRVRSAPLLGSIELTPAPGAGLYLAAWAGSDLLNRAPLDAHDRLVVGGALTWIY